MAKKSTITKKQLGTALIAGLIIQFVVPQIGFSGLDFISTAIYLFVALYLLFM